MAHEIHSVVFAGDVPWHGLGTRLPSNGSWDEIREAAGFYRAEERPLFLPGASAPVPDRKALVRGDDGRHLATVGDGYEVVQFEDLAKAGVLAAGDVQAIWHTAGTLGPNGARGWLLGELPNPIQVRDDESEVRKYVLLTTAHDGTSAAILKNVATRVVCKNTLGAALNREDGAVWRIRHTKSAKARLESAARAFHAMVTHFERFGELANAMAVQPFSLAQHKATLDAVLPIPEDDADHRRLQAQRECVLGLYDNFVGATALRGTAWGSFQAWTEWADHHRGAPVWASRDAAEKQFSSSMLGRSAQLKAPALSAILLQSGIRSAVSAAA